MSREQLIGLIAADSKFLDERDAITEYVRGLKAGEGLDEAAIRPAASGSRSRSMPPSLPPPPRSRPAGVAPGVRRHDSRPHDLRRRQLAELLFAARPGGVTARTRNWP